MRKVFLFTAGLLLVVISAGLVLYPFISNYLMSLNQEAEITAYQAEIDNVDSELLNEEIEAARQYNIGMYGSVMLTDPFDPSFMPIEDSEYTGLLNIRGDGIMGYVDIPKIDVTLPIYHGTSSAVLEKGVGHLQNTSLPVGGAGTHAVLTGHTGLSTARLFTDINRLEEGDVFLLHVLNETMAYEVDQLLVVLPSETDPLRVVPGEDYVTLLTCTPYGVNSHRLFVRGTRVPYTPELQQKVEATEHSVESTWMEEYRKAVIAGAVLLGILIIIIILVRNLLHRKRMKKAQLRQAEENT